MEDLSSREIVSQPDYAGGLIEGQHKGYYFNDSDLFKVIEGASYSLTIFSDPGLEKYLDEIIAKIAAAQEEDGYLYTARTAQRPDKLPPGGEQRWSNIADGHELYNVGHLYEAAVAHFQATGKSNLLDIALKNAGLILKEFGPGKIYRIKGNSETSKSQNFTAIPYYAWSHRGKGEMSVWLAREEFALQFHN